MSLNFPLSSSPPFFERAFFHQDFCCNRRANLIVPPTDGTVYFLSWCSFVSRQLRLRLDPSFSGLTPPVGPPGMAAFI